MTKGEASGRPPLRLIQGGLQREVWLEGLRVVAAGEEKAPFAVQAFVAEEDTYLVLSAAPQVFEPLEHPLRLMTALLDVEPQEPGSVVVKPGPPLRFLAVVHDLNREPTWRDEWVAQALAAVLREVEGRQLDSLALPLLGTVHGRLESERSLRLLREALEAGLPGCLRYVWLMTDDVELAVKILQERP